MRHFNVDDARPLIESEIQRLIDMLDALDADVDLEDVADLEPALSISERHCGSWTWTGLVDDDREVECEDEGAQCDDEGEINGDQEPGDCW